MGCDDPFHQGGSHIWALGPVHGLKDFEAVGVLVYSVPNDASGNVLNRDEMEVSGIPFTVVVADACPNLAITHLLLFPPHRTAWC